MVLTGKRDMSNFTHLLYVYTIPIHHFYVNRQLVDSGLVLDERHHIPGVN